MVDLPQPRQPAHDPGADPAEAIRDAALIWWDRIRGGYRVPMGDLQQQLSFERLERLFLGHLRRLGFLPTT